jgi:tyrosyl-tRNA synthetase
VLFEAKLVATKSEAHRAIEQGGVKIDDEKVTAVDQMVKKGSVVQKGKRFFVKVK